MAHFYGEIITPGGKTTRTGRKASGLVTHAATWDGAIRVELEYRDGHNWAKVSFLPWGASQRRGVIWEGRLDGKDENWGSDV